MADVLQFVEPGEKDIFSLSTHTSCESDDTCTQSSLPSLSVEDQPLSNGSGYAKASPLQCLLSYLNLCDVGIYCKGESRKGGSTATRDRGTAMERTKARRERARGGIPEHLTTIRTSKYCLIRGYSVISALSTQQRSTQQHTCILQGKRGQPNHPHTAETCVCFLPTLHKFRYSKYVYLIENKIYLKMLLLIMI